jgi:hypothetical protein
VRRASGWCCRQRLGQAWLVALVIELGDQCDQARLELAVAGIAQLERQPEGLGDQAGLLGQCLVVALRQVDQPAIVGEVGIAQLGEAIKPQALENGTLKPAHHEIGEEERARLRAHHGVEVIAAGIHFVAVRAGDARHVIVIEQLVEPAAGAAVAVHHHDPLKARDQLAQAPLDIGADLLWHQMIPRRHAEQRHIPAMPPNDRNDLAGQRTAEYEGDR